MIDHIATIFKFHLTAMNGIQFGINRRSHAGEQKSTNYLSSIVIICRSIFHFIACFHFEKLWRLLMFPFGTDIFLVFVLAFWLHQTPIWPHFLSLSLPFPHSTVSSHYIPQQIFIAKSVVLMHIINQEELVISPYLKSNFNIDKFTVLMTVGLQMFITYKVCIWTAVRTK